MTRLKSSPREFQWLLSLEGKPLPNPGGAARTIQIGGHRQINEMQLGAGVWGSMKKLHPSLYARHRFPAEVISLAVWLYFRFP
jgi:hypothetical protein